MLAALLVALAATPAVAKSRICQVADPTGTPLNIRLTPNGRIVARAPNRSPLQVFVGEGARDAKGRLWHLVALTDSSAPNGYALAAYIRCR